jgi:hypothetical protein
MDILSYFSVFIFNIDAVPDASRNVFILQLIKYTITGENDKIMILSNFESHDIRQADYNIWVSASEFILRFRVSKCSRD